MRVGNVSLWWKYKTLGDRILRRKTFYYHVFEENQTIGYQLRKNGAIWVVEVKTEKLI